MKLLKKAFEIEVTFIKQHRLLELCVTHKLRNWKLNLKWLLKCHQHLQN